MPIDPYSPCPGGTGKKVKFCCTDLQQELDKVERMLEGEQSKACLDYVRKLDEKYTGRACLQSIRVSLENAVGDRGAAEKTVAAFLAKYPDNPVAVADYTSTSKSKMSSAYYRMSGTSMAARW